MTQQVKPTPEEIYQFVEKHYAHVMTPWQLELTKRLLAGEPIDLARQGGKKITSRVINEAIAVITAGR